jgi:hypothetical protein
MRLLFSLLIAAVAPLTLAAAAPATPPYHDITREFERFHDATRAMPEAQRVAAFRKKFDVLFPGFYEPTSTQTDATFNASIAKALADFDALRSAYDKAVHDFPAAYAAGIAHFRKQFPGFKQTLPVWFLHSLGRMDGGTRDMNGKTYMIFGADVIARIHGDGTIGPFLDHEMFHVENAQWFKDCDTNLIWCGLWQEGGATYAASVMNPGADDHALMLDQPKPIRAAVDAHWREALCELRGDLDKSDDPTYARYFFGKSTETMFPGRWGYYVGYRMMQRIGQHHSLVEIDHMDHKAARAEIDTTLGAMITDAGGCA